MSETNLKLAEGVLRAAVKDCTANAASGVWVDADTIRSAYDAALDLRDTRALLREALGYVDEYTRLANDFGAEDVLRRGNQHLEGHDEQH